MKRYIAMLLAVLLLACLVIYAQAEVSKDERINRYVGVWNNDEFYMYITLEDDEILATLKQWEEDGYVWEFKSCYYDTEEDCLWCPNYIQYREHIDEDTLERVQEDWSLGDMNLTCLTFGDDEDTLIASDIPDIDAPQSFDRVSE